jgi:hypothetical protein
MKFYMQFSSVILIIVLLMPATSFAADGLHFGLSAVFGAASETVLHYKTDLNDAGRITLGTILGSLPGLAKEISDNTKEDNHFSGRQMGIDVAGAFVGAVIADLINNKIQMRIETNKKTTVISLLVEF